MATCSTSSASSSPASTPRSSSSFPASAEDIDDLEDLCRRELGFKLGKLLTRLRSHADEQESAFNRFCADLRSTQEPADRVEIAESLFGKLAENAFTALHRFLNSLAKVQVKNVQNKNDVLMKDISRYENEVTELKSALQRLELEKQEIEDKHEVEKGLLEFALREELQACQICLLNPRSIVIMPCLHGQFCGEYMEAHQKGNNACPTCRDVF
ncbi:hypothetical protein L7F22_058417 [Adiantum nelumboides]|nr:hypothetical protein [Adiantum nelumboides]